MNAISDAYLAASMRVDGYLSKIEFMENLARRNGTEAGDHSSAFRYLWIADDFFIYLDDRHDFMIAYYCDDLVCSTVPKLPPDGMIFVQGKWWDLIEPYRQEIEAIVRREEQSRTNQLIAESLRIPASVGW